MGIMERKNVVRKAISQKYIETSRDALDKISLAPPERSFLLVVAKDFLAMAKSYFDDALHFHKEGDYERALGAVNYAHGWLDAGARMGLFDVDEDEDLFTLYE